MKKIFPLLFFLLSWYTQSAGQAGYDSITISRFLIGESLYTANWKDSLKAGSFINHLSVQKTVWIKPAKPQKMLPHFFLLFNRIKTNGTEDISACFIPRHSINFYKAGKIVRFLLVCFECEGVQFSDEPVKRFVKSIATREKQMAELKKIFIDLL